MTHSPKTPTRAEALAAFKEYMAQTGLTPQDEQRRRYENIWKCRPVIEAALATDAPIVEGLDDALSVDYVEEKDPTHDCCGMIIVDPADFDALHKAARLYAQGRTQAVPDSLLARLKEQQEYHYQNSDRAQELSGDKEHYSASYVEAAKGNAIGECILVIEKILSTAPTPPVTGGALPDEQERAALAWVRAQAAELTGEDTKDWGAFFCTRAISGYLSKAKE